MADKRRVSVKPKPIEAILGVPKTAAERHNSLASAIGYPGGCFPGAIPQTLPGATPAGSMMGGIDQIAGTGTLIRNLRNFSVSNYRQTLSEAYMEIGLIQTITDLPVEDALRGGVTFKSKQMDEDELQDLKNALEEDDDIGKAAKGAQWTRLFGGGGVIIWVSDQDPAQPLNVNAISENSDIEFIPFDLWELYDQNLIMQEGDGPRLFMPTPDKPFYTYYTNIIHKSRVLTMKGLVAPSYVRPRLRGWGFSVVESLVRSLNQYLKATDLGFQVLDEFKLDVYKIKNLTSSLFNPQAEANIRMRVQLANWQKNYQNAVVMDAEDDFASKSLSFTGLSDVMAGVRMQVAGDMRMPLSKLFGISAQGFNSGEDDIEVYNSMIESTIRVKLRPDLLKIAKLKSQQLFGYMPDDLTLEWKPLRELSATDQETVKTQKFTRILQAKERGEITTREFRDACNKGQLLDITLDTENLGEEADLLGVVEAEGGDDKSPGAAKDKSESPEAKQPPAKKLSVVNSDDKPMKSDGLVLTGAALRGAALRALLKGKRAQLPPRVRKNSFDFDRASYEADGGDSWIDAGKKELFENPVGADSVLWLRAQRRTVEAWGDNTKWQYTVWIYEKMGGKFT